ncbi:MAG: hypothetical protein YK1309IOTA_1390003 [Marine Group I thaumarchaeote]|nr:MAG: hypothetical protein YK1309IOTA_1390003 [Marine Group I thaumarchaeote]
MKNATKKTADGSTKVSKNIASELNEKISSLIEKAKGRVRESESEDYVSELQINRQKEARFRLMVFRMLRESEKLMWPESDLVNSCAEELDFSPTTARKYLAKLCSSRGILKRMVVNNIKHITFKLDGFLK